MKTEVEELIRLIQQDQNFKLNSTPYFTGEDEDWYYYAYITGYFNDSYFALNLDHNKLNNNPEFIISALVTENPIELKEHLKTISTINFKIF